MLEQTIAYADTEKVTVSPAETFLSALMVPSDYFNSLTLCHNIDLDHLNICQGITLVHWIDDRMTAELDKQNSMKTERTSQRSKILDFHLLKACQDISSMNYMYFIMYKEIYLYVNIKYTCIERI